MKKSILMGLGICALALGGVAALVGQKGAVETKADYSKISLACEANAQADPEAAADGYKFTYVGNKDGWHYYNLPSVSLNKGDTFKIRDWETGHNSDWMNYYNSEFVQQGLDKETDGDKNLVCKMTGQYSVTYRWKDIDHKEIVGFDLSNAVDTYFVCDNLTWAASGKMYIHAWGTSGDLTDGDSSCPINPVAGVTVGNAGYRFYRVKVPSAANGFLLKAYWNNTDYKTGNLYEKGLCYTANNTDGYGVAGQIIGKIYSNMGEASYQENSYDFSICATSYANAQSIISSYNGATGAAKTILDSSSINTYDVVNGGTKDVPIADIIASLGTIQSPLPGGLYVSHINDKSSLTLIISVIGITAALAVGGLFLLRKRKAE